MTTKVKRCPFVTIVPSYLLGMCFAQAKKTWVGKDKGKSFYTFQFLGN